MRMKKTKKTHLDIKVGRIQQILLCHTNRNEKDFFKSIDWRYSNNDKKPNYFIDKKGKITQINKEDVTHNYLRGYHTNKSVIVVCLENRGWVKRRSSDGKYVDWLGDIYDKRPIEKKWRGMLYWDPYSDKQMDSTKKLVEELCLEYTIPNHFVGHNTLVEGINKFKGITTKSNYNEFWRDLNPTFNFEIL
jgi:N-acetyl-anhydromuramyl-L-alanine amidase AmpD